MRGRNSQKKGENVNEDREFQHILSQTLSNIKRGKSNGKTLGLIKLKYHSEIETNRQQAQNINKQTESNDYHDNDSGRERGREGERAMEA